MGKMEEKKDLNFQFERRKKKPLPHSLTHSHLQSDMSHEDPIVSDINSI